MYRVIILEDNKIDARLMKAYLNRANAPFREIELVYDKDSYEQALQTFQPDLIVADYRLQGFNGLGAIELKNCYCEEIPIIIVSATIGEEKAVELIKAGAADFLIKNNMEARLAQVSQRAIEERIEKKKRRIAEQSLVQSRNRYQMLFNTSLDGIMIGLPDEEGRILDANPAFCELLGYTQEEIKQLKRSHLFADPPEQLEKKLKERAAKNQFRGELMARHKDGHLIPLEVNSLIVDSEDDTRKSFSIIRDIRLRKETEVKEKWQNKILALEKDLGKILNENISIDESLEKCIDRILRFLDWDVGHLYIHDTNDDSEFFRSTNIWSRNTSKNLDAFVDGTMKRTFSSKEGCVGKVAHTQKALWLQLDRKGKSFQRSDFAKASGIQTGLLLPILLKNQTEAVLEFYTTKPEKKDKKLTGVLEKVSLQIARLLERHRNYQALNEEKDRYRLIAHNSTDVIARTDPDGIILYCSPSSKLMGYTPEELIGTSAYDYFHPDDLEKITHSHQEVLKNNDTYLVNYRLKQKDGSWRWVETLSKPIKNPNTGEVEEIQTSTRDITDRKRYEQELQEQVQLNDQIINSLPGIFFIVSREGEIKRVNNQLRELITPPEDEEFHFNRFVAPEDHAKAQNALTHAFKKGFSQVELHLKTDDGRNVPFLMTGIVNRLSNNEYLIGTGINIEERIRIEKELLREKRFVDQAINSLPGLFYVLDKEQNFVRINNTFIEALGYSREEINQMNPIDFYLKEDHEKVQQVIEKAFTEGQATLISQVKTKHGKTPYFFITASHFKEEGKDYILGTGVEITEQIKLEELLNQTQRMAKIGAWEYNLETNKLSWTDVTRDLHEVDPDFEPDLEKTLNFYRKGEHRDRMRSALEKALSSGTPYDLELQVETAKGNIRWIREIGNAEIKDGRCVRLYGSYQDIHEKKIAEENLKQSLREKEVLLMEIHHRVKNNLALVSGFMQLQALQTENETVHRCLSDSQSRIKSIAIIHEHLYQNNSLSVIKLKENIITLVDHIRNSIAPDKDIDVELDVMEINVNINQAIPFALIVNELLTNCYKHAFKGRENGKIRLSLQLIGDVIYLEIQDNGIGLPDNFTLNEPNSLGVNLLRTLSTQINGDLTFHTDEKGTCFKLQFKKLDRLQGASSNFVQNTHEN